MSHGRTLRCQRCRVWVRVYEAAMGATTLADHQFLDAASFVCGGCKDNEGATVTAPALRNELRLARPSGRAPVGEKEAA